MEQRKPHHNLASFRRACCSVESLRVTKIALNDAFALGFSRAGVVDVIQSIRPGDFYKSMTSLADHTIWQDVYHVPWDGLVLYVKFTDDRLTGFLLLSFKEK